jgi:hypothetical protein
MKRILVATVTILLIATAGVKAGPPMSLFDTPGVTSLAENAQFKKKGKGFKKGPFKKGAFKKKAGGKSGPGCFNKCVATGKPGAQCQGRCR